MIFIYLENLKNGKFPKYYIQGCSVFCERLTMDNKEITPTLTVIKKTGKTVFNKCKFTAAFNMNKFNIARRLDNRCMLKQAVTWHDFCFLFVDILRDKKNEAKTISACINETKLSIDETKIALEELTVTRECSEDRKDDVILDEDEFQLIQKLKGLKSTYRMNYEHLQNLRSDIFYCEKLVKQCRQQLLAEFQVWYEASFGVKEEADVCLDTTNSKKLPDAEKEANEKSEKIATKYTCPGSMAFYNARTQTNMRKLGAIRKRPGSVTSTLRNAPPPNSMIIH